MSSADSLTRQFLRELSGARIRWALLQSPPSDLGSWADCDMACDLTGPEILLRLREEFQERKWAPIVLVNYDVGRSDAFWIWSSAEQTVVQFDVLSDPRGMGRLGICTDALLEAASVEMGLFVTTRRWQEAYRISKDLRKRKPIARSTASWDPNSPEIRSTFGGRRWGSFTSLSEALEAGVVKDQDLRLGLWRARRQRSGLINILSAELLRRYMRIRRRAGRWIHIEGPAAQRFAEVLRDAFAGSLPVDVRPITGGPWMGSRAWIETLRPRVLITWGNRQVSKRLVPPHAIALLEQGASDEQSLIESVMQQLACATFRQIE